MGRHKEQTGKQGAVYTAKVWEDKKGSFSCRVPKPLMNTDFKEITGYFSLDVEKGELKLQVLAWVKDFSKLKEGSWSAEDNAP